MHKPRHESRNDKVRTLADSYPLTVRCEHCGGMFFRADLRVHLAAQKQQPNK